MDSECEIFRLLFLYEQRAREREREREFQICISVPLNETFIHSLFNVLPTLIDKAWIKKSFRLFLQQKFRICTASSVLKKYKIIFREISARHFCFYSNVFFHCQNIYHLPHLHKRRKINRTTKFIITMKYNKICNYIIFRFISTESF